MKRSNMYTLSVAQLNPHVGCLFECRYCKPSFQRQLKRWAKGKCEKCYQFKPHGHLERLKQKLPTTRYMQFIFLCSNGDVAFCPTPILEQIRDFTKLHSDKTFLIQSKSPKTFNRVKFPKNVILGTTIETDKNHFYSLPQQIYPTKEEANRNSRYDQISKAPSTTERIIEFQKILHPLKMLTYEPVLNFTVEGMVTWAELIQPCMIWLGMDSKPKQNRLPEPSLEKVRELHWELARRGFVVILKMIRKAWWQK